MSVRWAIAVAVLAILVALPAGSRASTPFIAPVGAAAELTGERSSTKRSWRLASGEVVTQIAGGPVQWRDLKGHWREYDLRLLPLQGGFVGRVGRASVRLPGALGERAAEAVEIANGAGATVAMRLLGASGKGWASTGGVTYRGVRPGVDLRFELTPEGLKEDVILVGDSSDRSVAYELATTTEGLRVDGDGQGGMIVWQGQRRVFAISRPFLIDASGERSDDASYRVERREPGVWKVTTELPNTWLDDPAREWPVTVDPTVNTLPESAAQDCQHRRDHIHFNQTCSGGERVIGSGIANPFYPVYYGATGWQFLRFASGTPVIQSDTIESATLRMHRLDSQIWEEPTQPPRDPSGSPTHYPWEMPSEINVYPTRIPFRNWDQTQYHANRKAVMAPSPPGMVEADVTEIATEWQRHAASGGAQGYANNGLALFHRELIDQGGQYIACWFDECDWTRFASSFHADPEKRPVLEIRSWPSAPVGNVVTSPREGDLSGRFLPLQARALSSSVTGVRFQYVLGSGSRWQDVPVSALRTTDRQALSDPVVSVSGPSGDRESQLVVWDLAATPNAQVDGPVRVRAYLESSLVGQGGVTPYVNMRLDRLGIARTATTAFGPGTLDLSTGEFSSSEQDVSFATFLDDLALSRTYTSRGVPNRHADMFGPGWEGSVDSAAAALPFKSIYSFTEFRDEVIERVEASGDLYDFDSFIVNIADCMIPALMYGDEAAFAECFALQPPPGDYREEVIRELKRWEYRYATVEFSDGTKGTFKQTVDGAGTPTGWVPEDGLSGYTLTRNPTDRDGFFEFVLREPAGGVARFRNTVSKSPHHAISSYEQPGSRSATSYAYTWVGGRNRLTRVVAPYPTGGTPRWLQLDWGAVNRVGPVRVTSVRVGSGTETGTTVAQYAYEGTHGRLVRVSDPRISPALVTEYRYDNRGLLTEIVPPGETPWRLAYTFDTAGDAGPRLVSVSRQHPSGGTATRTVRYGVPLSGVGAPHDMSIEETARWGQVDDIPWQAVAIFPADVMPDATNPDYARATVHYLDIQGREVNLAEPGGHISTVAYDAADNPIRSLTATNRARALAGGGDTAGAAHDLSTINVYSRDGSVLDAVYEPQTSIRLQDGTTVVGRRLTSTQRDVGAPSTGGPFRLPTSRWRAVELPSGTRVDQREIVRYSYDSHGGMSGWTARHATKTIVDPHEADGAKLTAMSILHPNYPVVEETRKPRGAAGGDRSDVRFYQYADITPSSRIPAALRTGSVCAAGTPAGFLCMESESTSPTASVPRRWYGYNALGLQTDLWESRTLTRSGAPARHTVTSYDPAGRVTGTTVIGGEGQSVPPTTVTYDAGTGREATASAPGRGTVSTAYDSNGRVREYVDANGLTTRYHYDLRGRAIETVENGSRTVRYGYDEVDNLTTVADPALPGPIVATYDADGKAITETLPNGLQARYAYDETGAATSLTWRQTTGCVSDCERARSVVEGRDADGRITGHQSAGDDEAYTYDRVGRLARVDTRSGDVCTRQEYVYDPSYNRTRADTTISLPAGMCGTGASTARTWSHDVADRITTVGWTHDDFGRATVVPAPDSGGRGALLAQYYADDLVRQLSLDGRTHIYDRDPLGRTAVVRSTGGSILVIASRRSYSDDTDSPVVTTRSDGTIVRYISGPSGHLVAIQDDTTLIYQLSDIHGSIVSTVPANVTIPSIHTAYDSFGSVTTPTPNVLNWTKGVPGYGWLGARERTTEFEQFDGSGSPMEMGVRVYLPAVGRFLQVDPVDGGSANSYEYAYQDPVNNLDLSGARSYVPPHLRELFRSRSQLRAGNPSGLNMTSRMVSFAATRPSRVDVYYNFSIHAEIRMVQRGITRQQVRSAIRNGELYYDQKLGNWTFVGDGFRVAFDQFVGIRTVIPSAKLPKNGRFVRPRNR